MVSPIADDETLALGIAKILCKDLSYGGEGYINYSNMAFGSVLTVAGALEKLVDLFTL